MTENKQKNSKIIKLIKAFTVAIFVAVNLFLYIPINLYEKGKSDLIFSIETIMPYCLHLGVLVFVLMFLSVLFTPYAVHKLIYALALSLTLLSFFHYSISVYIDFDGYLPQILDFLIWLLVIAISVIAAMSIDKDRAISIICIFLSVAITLSQAISIFLSLSENDFSLEKIGNPDVKQDQNISHKKTDMICWDNLYPISKSNNIFYFCVDRFDEEFAEEAYSKDKHIYDELKGFTWYQDNISDYGHTFPAVTKMLTGVDWNTEENRYSYFKRAYSSKNYLSELYKKGYKINLFTSPYYVFSSKSVPYYVSLGSTETNNIYYNSDGQKKVGKQFISNTLFNCLPSIFRNSFNMVGLTGCNSYAVADELRSSDLKRVYDHIKDGNFKETDQKLFSFIHTDGCHYVQYNSFWHKPIIFKKSITPTVKNSMKVINTYIEAMKKIGVYDNATIIITGDHANPVDDVKPLDGTRLTALFVKTSKDSKSDLKISQKQVCHDNIWPTILESENINLNISTAQSISQVTDADRTRIYKWDTYEPNKKVMDEYTYEIIGKGTSFENWRIVSQKHYDKFLMD